MWCVHVLVYVGTSVLIEKYLTKDTRRLSKEHGLFCDDPWKWYLS